MHPMTLHQNYTQHGWNHYANPAFFCTASSLLRNREIMQFTNSTFLWFKCFGIWVHLVSVLSFGPMVLLWQEQREATCRLGQQGYRSVCISEHLTGKICQNCVSINQGPLILRPESQKASAGPNMTKTSLDVQIPGSTGLTVTLKDIQLDNTCWKSI